MLGDDNIIIVLSCVAHSLTFITTKWQNPKIKLKKNSFIILASVAFPWLATIWSCILLGQGRALGLDIYSFIYIMYEKFG